MTRTTSTRPASGTAERTVALLRDASRRTGVDVVERLRTVGTTLEPDVPASEYHHLEGAVGHVLRLLAAGDTSHIWLVLAVTGGVLPDAETVVRTRRAMQLRGPGEVLKEAAASLTPASARRDVSVARGITLVDLGDLVVSPLGTGIQRVARNVSTRWAEDRDVVFVGWTPGFDALRALTPAETKVALTGTRPEPTTDADDDHAARSRVLVPWECHYLLPELAIDPARCAAMQSLAAYSSNRTGVIGFDCVPITSSETAATGFAGVFALNLAAVAHFDTVGAISRAAAAEYEGWCRMLDGAGLRGPAVHAVGLPTHAPEPSPEALEEASARFLVPGLPLVLCVGSHEPRKNHLAVLHAAEVLWRRGLRFSLSFVGGHSWGSDEFSSRLSELQGAGRPVESVSRLPDRLLWAAYRLARCTVFPSLNEGFGLPVAESLAAGTPAITSGFGSMLEIAEHGGALLVDPRKDEEIADALATLLTDDATLVRLQHEANGRPREDWGSYADRLWELFHAPGRAATPSPGIA